jgi:hypothetical protein
MTNDKIVIHETVKGKSLYRLAWAKHFSDKVSGVGDNSLFYCLLLLKV